MNIDDYQLKQYSTADLTRTFRGTRYKHDDLGNAVYDVASDLSVVVARARDGLGGTWQSVDMPDVLSARRYLAALKELER